MIGQLASIFFLLEDHAKFVHGNLDPSSILIEKIDDDQEQQLNLRIRLDIS